jgi:glutaminyl-peptide cyclotransferase
MRRVALPLAMLLLPRLAGAQSPAPVVRPNVIAEYPHDAQAFTQGLLSYDGWFYESTGLRGRSTVRRVDPATGRVDQVTALPDTDFGEGLALVDDRLIQLTWQENHAYVYDRATLTQAAEFSYDGEGWGLCYDGQRLVMSDGSSSLFFRNPDSFELLGSVVVTRDGTPVDQLNELECVGALVYANVWQTDEILRIDPSTGEVQTRIDASGLLTTSEARVADVLNGIAYDEQTDHFFITGKLWPKLFEVSFDFSATNPEPAPAPTTTAAPDVPVEPAPSTAGTSVEPPASPPSDSATPSAPAAATASPDLPSPPPAGASGRDSSGCRAATGTAGTKAPLAWALLFASSWLVLRRKRAR